MGANRVLLRCECGNYKFVDEENWEKVEDKNLINFFNKKILKGEYDVEDIICPECELSLRDINYDPSAETEEGD
jgi:hypothetical protein